MISIQDISYSYPSTEVFDGFSMQIDYPMFGLIGKNGAGKTTLLNLMIGLLLPSKGKVLVNGLDTRIQVDEIRKQIGVLTENPRFPSWYRVLDHLVWLGRLRGLEKKDAFKQSNFLLEQFDLSHKRDALVSSLSAGMRQKFGLAQALIGLPRVILLDEPTSNLDAESRVKVLNFLKDVSVQKEVQIVILSHVLSDLERFCDGFAIIHEGKLLLKDTMANLLSREHPREFILRLLPGTDVDPILKELQNHGGNILKTNQRELIVRFENPTDASTVRLPEGFSLLPNGSVLEQVFLRMTQSQEGGKEN